MKIISWNVNGIRAVVKKTEAWTAFQQLGADVLCLQETRFGGFELPKPALQVLGEHRFRVDGEKKGYSGVLTASRFPCSAADRAELEGALKLEGRVCSTIHEVEGVQFALINCYFPNGYRNPERLKYKLGFYCDMAQYISMLQERMPVILVGDLNTTHYADEDEGYPSEFGEAERQWLDIFEDLGLRDVWRERNPATYQTYTWWDYMTRGRARNRGWRIDYVFVDERIEHLVRDAQVHDDYMGSDHCPVSVTLGTP